jgi:ubiquinone/menaquinone biosynthesis C-methylase UbiE
MLKSFVPAQGSQEVSFWEDYFASQSFDYLVQSFSTDPLRPLFERYCAGGARVLEGGCGLGNYLPCLRGLGARPIGLDFGVDMLKQVRRRDAPTPLTAGDVCALPFRDQTLDVYYSGGVMEHFEAGPAQGIAEAYRVLKPGGIFLVSVPFENPVRRTLAKLRSESCGLVVRAVDQESKGEAPEGLSFFQYFYRGPEFRRRLEAQGFEVLNEQPYSLWRGLTDIDPFRWLDNLYAGRARTKHTPAFRPSGNGGPTSAAHASRLKKSLKRWIFAEDRTIPVFGTLVSVGCEMAANMRMYVCRRP